MRVEADKQLKPAAANRSRKLSEWAQWLEERQISLSFGLIAALLAATHVYAPEPAVADGVSAAASSSLKARLRALASHNPRTGLYAVGPGDLLLVLLVVLLLTGLRAAAMKLVLSPLAARWGVARPADATRFAEQAWMLLYYNIFWPFGMYLYCGSGYFLDMEALWTDWPRREIAGPMKAYTLAQLAFWAQQVLVIHLERRRKDHAQMLGHHLVTVALITAAYAYHQTKVGNLIMVLMDVIDLFLPLAKCLKYLGFTWICDVLFGFFVLSWVGARHVLFLVTCWSVYADLPRLTPDACFRGSAGSLRAAEAEGWRRFWEPFADPTGRVCFGRDVGNAFLVLLLALQAMMMVWFTFIVRIIVKIVQGHRAEDVRSDSEEDEDE
ncbi:TRAM1-like protein & fumonisin [Cordyceps fumosorosea ARSEF 2679]|uniref:TRAM1-like protein & fumonisin n=1 Tax=Cordyceps fumosorosea (strain ARSEF 2679) TaxID=1081104 RepID=A0A167PZS8_CORFA|nr:TRAM1-like protein & fumonisin [Cordyceps fumosorosea ARSEF 2679]OAA57164.1 TRAM1-like protein & fumonisin [Cordyceps fumosorosea ARSEF 2679]